MEKRLGAPGVFYKYVNIIPKLLLLIKYGTLHSILFPVSMFWLKSIISNYVLPFKILCWFNELNCSTSVPVPNFHGGLVTVPVAPVVCSDITTDWMMS